MHKIAVLLLAAAGVSLAGAASAADIAARPVYTKAPVAPVWSWTGSYMGLYAGGAFSANNTTTANPLGAGFLFAGAPSTSYKLGSSFIGGYTSGYNYQFAPNWLIGYEGETGYIHMKGTGGYVGAPATAFGQTEMGNIYSVAAARFGYVMDRSLIYAKGGATWTRFDTGAFDPAVPSGITGARNVFGYAAGGGWEYAFDPKWSLKAEYLYLGFDKTYSYVGNTGGAQFTGSTTFAGVHTAKVGLNYKWGLLDLLWK